MHYLCFTFLTVSIRDGEWYTMGKERTRMKKILVGQSGGPTAVINASLLGVIKAAAMHGLTVYGMVNGIEGYLKGKSVNLTEYGKKADLELLKVTPASFLGSCRFKLPEDLTDPVYPEIMKRLNEEGFDGVFYIGGNDSMDTVDKLGKYGELTHSPIRFMGIPKTIDNDLVLTDHTPGFGSTAKYVASTLREIILDAGSYLYPVVTIVELMGRNAGWITAASVLARSEFEPNPVLIYLPEAPFELDRFLKDVKEAMKKQSNVVVCVSEGIKDKKGNLICESNASRGTDQFGHKLLTGCGKILEEFIRVMIGCKCRSIEINLPQRCCADRTSACDTREAEMAGMYAVEQAMKGASRKMAAFHRISGSGEPYQMECCLVNAADVCNKEKLFPAEWILNGNDIAPQFLEYALPLIQGENTLEYENGLPKMLTPIYRVPMD